MGQLIHRVSQSLLSYRTARSITDSDALKNELKLYIDGKQLDNTQIASIEILQSSIAVATGPSPGETAAAASTGSGTPPAQPQLQTTLRQPLLQTVA